MRPHLLILAFVATNKNDAAHFMIIVLCGCGDAGI
jgi:hypothetical protein